MVEDLKNHESGQENENPMASLADEKSFAEHMEDVEKESSIGEKYYQQAEAEKARWIEISRNELGYWEELQPKELKICINPDYWRRGIYSGEKEPIYRPIDEENTEDMASFNDYKDNMVEQAKDRLKKDEDIDLDWLAKAFHNQELVDQISIKLENDEDFTDDEIKFLGKTPNLDCLFPDYDYMVPKECYRVKHGFTNIPRYEDLLDPEDYWGEAKAHPEWATIAKAQVREMIREGKSLLHSSEEVQNSLKNMEERRTANPFAGETNLNSATGEARTFTPEDNYPRREDESEEDYAKRLKRIQLKSRQAEMRR